jgi:hypothetical protein
MAAFQFYLQTGLQRKVAGGQVSRVGWVGDNNHVVFGKKSLVKKKEVLDGALS